MLRVVARALAGVCSRLINRTDIQSNVVHATTGQAHVIASDAHVADGQWHHIAGVWTAGQPNRIFIDGELAAEGVTKSGSILDPGLSVGLGRYPTDRSGTGNQNYIGQIAGARISNVARYSDSFSPSATFSNDADTLAAWNFDEGNGTTLDDISNNNRDGIIYGPSWFDDCSEDEVNDGGISCANDADCDGVTSDADCDDQDDSVSDAAECYDVTYTGGNGDGCRDG